jgi:hypothetical protein
MSNLLKSMFPKGLKGFSAIDALLSQWVSGGFIVQRSMRILLAAPAGVNRV